MEIKQIDQKFSVSDQIQLMDVETIAAKGFRAIVNFRPDGEGGQAQVMSEQLAAKASSLGLAYAYIPVQPNQITAQHVAQLSEFMSKNNGSTLGFCRTGNRANQVYQQLEIAQDVLQKPACCCHEHQAADTKNSLLKKLSQFFK